MRKEGIQFNNIHTSEYNLSLISREGNPPEKKRVTESVPYMQGEYDFFWMVGYIPFENRTLVYNFLLVNYKYEDRKVLETALSNWSLGAKRQKLVDDAVPGYYFLAECVKFEFVDTYHGMEVKLTFDTYPFKIAEMEEGNDLWDPFNFELDVAQTTSFDVNGSVKAILYNPGANNLNPKIKTSAPMKIMKDGITYDVPEGESSSSDFILTIGENGLTIEGKGTVSFHFYKELV
ncbi:phage tail protein [Paenibacillus larvae]